MPKYNHLYAVAFSVVSSSKDPDQVEPWEILNGLSYRLSDLDSDLNHQPPDYFRHEAVEYLGDVYEVDE